MTFYVVERAAAFLKSNTTQTHTELEDVVQPRLLALRTVTDYTSLLLDFYGYFKPVEDSVAQFVDARVLPDISERRKAIRILQDLTFSNTHIDFIPLAKELPRITNLAEALGALYVLEGSTLGGRGITKMLLKNEHLQLQENQVQFFNGYGAETGPRWQAFIHVLNETGTTPEAQQQMAATANHTFSLFKTWLLKK